jgi:organic radical activating enzyme
VCGVCNYDCSYCIQAPHTRVGHLDDVTLDAMLAFLSQLDGTWEIKMTGGEPFAFKGFMDRIIPFLAGTRHRISTLTNLSAPLPVLQRFAHLTSEKLTVLSASLHLQSTTAREFVDKLTHFRGWSPASRIVVNSVLDPDNLPAVAHARKVVEDAGFTFFPQLMKVKGGVFPYSPGQMELVRGIVGNLEEATLNRTANVAPAYTGRRCFTGARYFVLMQNGDAWSCRSAKREGDGFLGNVATGVKLRGGPVICPYTICPCTVPANRGMIEGVR